MMLRWPFAKVHIPLTRLCMFCMSASLFSFILVRRLILAFNFASSWHFKYLTLSSNTVSQPVSPYHLSFVTRWLVKLSNLSSICCEGPHDPFRWPRGFVSFLMFCHVFSLLEAEVVAFTIAFLRHPLAQVRAGAVGRALHMCWVPLGRMLNHSNDSEAVHGGSTMLSY
jgi:hypothetical protein